MLSLLGRRGVFVVVLLVAASGSGRADAAAGDKRLKGYTAAPGVHVEIVAEQPAVENPVALAFGADGSAFVLERSGGGDRIKVFAPVKGEVGFGESKVVLEEASISGMLVHDDWLYVAGRGTVRRYRQTKAGGPYDVREVIASGFAVAPKDAKDRRDASIGLVMGVDGWLTIIAGAGDHVVVGKGDSRATALGCAAVFRCRPDGSRLRLAVSGLADAAADAGVDDVGNLFVHTRKQVVHVAEGSDFGQRGDVGERIKAGLVSAGVTVYRDLRFPEDYRGSLVVVDGQERRVRLVRAAPNGSTFQMENAFDLLKSDDPLFRPRQSVVGPDAAIYVVDSRSDGARETKNGRIYRLTWSGTDENAAISMRPLEAAARLAKLSDDVLTREMEGADAMPHAAVQKALRARGKGIRGSLTTTVESERPSAALRAACLGVLEDGWDEAVEKTAVGLLTSADSDMRRLAAEALGRNVTPGKMAVHDALLHAIGDEDPTVARAVAVAMGRVGADGAADALVNVFAFDDGKDQFLRNGRLWALESLGQVGVDRLLALGDSGQAKATDKVVEAFGQLRTRPAAEAVPTLLQNPHLSIEQRAGLLRSFGRYRLDPPVSLQPVADFLMGHPDEAAKVKEAGVETLAAGGERSRELVIALVNQDEDEVLRRAGVNVLGLDAVTAKQAAQRWLDGKMKKDRVGELIEALMKHAGADAEAERLLGELRKGKR